MPNSGPPWVQTVLVTVIVENKPVVPQPATELAAGGVGRYSGSAITYQTIATWTVAALRTGQLIEISMVGSPLAKILFQVVIGAVTFMTEQRVDTSLTIPFTDLTLVAGSTVTIQCKSTDGSAIIADASIVAKEIY